MGRSCRRATAPRSRTSARSSWPGRAHRPRRWCSTCLERAEWTRNGRGGLSKCGPTMRLAARIRGNREVFLDAPCTLRPFRPGARERSFSAMFNAKAYAVASATSPFSRTTIARRDPTEHDVQREIHFCGICHSDLHQARSEWSGMPTVYPCVPRHEIVGRVRKVGSAVTQFKPGDLAGVGCMVDSDGTCPECQAGFEQFCASSTFTYNSPDKHLGGVTYGGYSDSVVVDERFVLRVPSNLDLAGTAPLLCAGITTWSPMRRQGVTKDKKVGVVGLGGLGHMGVKFARALGAHVVVFTTSPGKKEDALRLGAHETVVSRDANTMRKHAGSFDFILDTVSADHDVNAYLQLLRRDGNLSLVGGIRQTQEMLDFCGQHGITADVEVIPMQKVDEAYERLLKADVKYRFSIEMASLKSE